MIRILSLLTALFCLAPASQALSAPKITELTAELEMKDFHDSTVFSGPVRIGVPVVITFKNNAVVKLVPVAIEESIIRVKAQLLRASGNVLYNSTFFTKYNADAELTEKKLGGDLVYRLKLNPHTEAKK
jgi:hypothetical protein